MKAIICLLLFLHSFFSYTQNQSQINFPKIDERIELISIAFRLADSPEYSSEVFKFYTNRIRDHYSSFKDHELIEFIRKIRNEKGVSHDAVIKMAVHLDMDFNPRIEFTDQVPDPRWGKENAYEFVRLIKEFYRDSRSEKFFRGNQKLYLNMGKAFRPVFDELDAAWYEDFYGKELKEDFNIVISPGNGGSNYGASVVLPDGKKEIYAIMGTWTLDSLGFAKFPVRDYFPTLVHEFNHSFVNEMLLDNEGAFRESGKHIFSQVEEQMKNGAYGSWQSMINEALVRAAVIKYMKDHSFPEKEIKLEILEQLGRGFVWIEDLVAELENYDANRDHYATLEDFIPKLAESYSDYARNIQLYIKEQRTLSPRLLSISEFKNGSQQVDPNIKQLSLNFDKVFMRTNFIRPGNESNAFPQFTGINYSEDRKTVLLNWDLESNKEYEFYLIDICTESEKNCKANGHLIRFKTK